VGPLYRYSSPARGPDFTRMMSPFCSDAGIAAWSVVYVCVAFGSGAKPIVLRASATPIEAAPLPPPKASAALTAATTAVMLDVSLAVSVTAAACVMFDDEMNAFVCVVLSLYAEAPAPLNASAATPAPSATDAAHVTALIE